VWVGDAMVAKKDMHGFPSDHEVLAAVQEAMGKESSAN
jgi:hypothetical protein